jgi:UDP-GlcNAc3NAcA epimerase
MRIASIVGARPQFIKLAPLSRAVARRNALTGAGIEDFIVHTGQHYDDEMSQVFFDELEMPAPRVNLSVGSGSHGVQTGRMLEKIEALLEAERPDITVVYGDTNSTLAAALAAVKLGIPVAHIEAGLRSFNRSMPEEINRIATDHISDILFAPTATAVRNLRDENLAGRTVAVGDVMYDAVLFNRDLARAKSRVLDALGGTGRPFGIVTIHRAENTHPENLRRLLGALNAVAESLDLVFPVHPRTRKTIETDLKDWSAHRSLRLIRPVGYLDMLRLVDSATLVLTDSGGLQKEAFMLGRPCVTLREETEWVESVERGANVVVGSRADDICAAVDAWLCKKEKQAADIAAAAKLEYGDGRAAEKILDALQDYHLNRETKND